MVSESPMNQYYDVLTADDSVLTSDSGSTRGLGLEEETVSDCSPSTESGANYMKTESDVSKGSYTTSKITVEVESRSRFRNEVACTIFSGNYSEDFDDNEDDEADFSDTSTSSTIPRNPLSHPSKAKAKAKDTTHKHPSPIQENKPTTTPHKSKKCPRIKNVSERLSTSQPYKE